VTPELGHFALTLALAVAVVQSIVPLIGAANGSARFMGLGNAAAEASFLLVAFSFAALTYAHVTSDFSVANVVANSHTAKPLLYKVTGVWGNHEGSMLLWVLMLTFFGAIVAVFGKAMPPSLRARALAVQGMIAAAFLVFVLIAANPFLRVVPAPLEGNDLNPLLQDPGLAFHPPMLYLGYVGFSLAFSFSAAALIEGRMDAAWARAARPFILLAWSALTLGVAGGSWWSYYELGWGGYWAWDPVENASLMPWLAGTALLHSAIVLEKREAMRSWTAMLSILTFSFSLLGTFLVRSGVLVSVHSFASDPTRGLFILTILALAMGGAFALFLWRAPKLQQGSSFAFVSRESALLLNNVLIVAAAAAVFIGTVYPLVLEALTGARISVGPPYFRIVFVPIAAALLLALPVGTLLAWKRAHLAGALKTLIRPWSIALLAATVAGVASSAHPFDAALGMGLSAWLIGGSLAEIARRLTPTRRILRQLTDVPRATWAMVCAHAGLGVLVAGISGIAAWQQEALAALKPGDKMALGEITITLEAVTESTGPNYVAQHGRVALRRNDEVFARLEPERRFYPVQGTVTTEAAIRTTLFSDLYVVLGEAQGQGAYALHAYEKPLAPLIWLGAMLSALGGLVSLSGRARLLRASRLAAGAPARLAGE
jgi:cytochrome c-type biogenesis protein CcmF